MDAGPTYVKPGFAGRTGRRVSKVSTGNFDGLISELRKAEAAIIRDICKLQKTFTPENTGKLLISAIREELFRRIETMNTQSISEVSDKVITNTRDAVKSHPASTTLVTLGIGSLIVENLLKQRAAGGKTDARQGEPEQHEVKLKFSTREESAKQSDATTPKSKSAMEGISNYMEENPLMVGLMGVSAGLVLGVLTRGVLSGNEFLDETRRTVKNKTRQILHETKEKAGHVIGVARQAAREEAERQNLMLH